MTRRGSDDSSGGALRAPRAEASGAARLSLAAALALTSAFSTAALAESPEHAGPEEVIAKVRQAAALLEQQGEQGLIAFQGESSEFMWKDTYVFVVNCDADEVLANPAFPERVGGDIKRHTDYAGKQYGLELCETAGRPGGGWIEYVWPRRGEDSPERKTSYVLPVPGRPFQVGAGIYNATLSLEELEGLARSDADS